jgi:tryptophan-rich sensory protein
MPLYVAGAGALIVAVAGGLATRIGPWYFNLRKPAWQPPDWLFGPVWTVIFALCALAAARAWGGTGSVLRKKLVLVLFVVNGLLNVGWSVLFFTLRRPDWALAEIPLLWLSIALIMYICGGDVPAVRWLLAPYLAWVTFAAALNLAVVQLNYPFV